jgi:glycosyltransferase involved in cell wall biosynthesis
MIDIINAYVKAGNTCILITGRIIERNNALDPSVGIERIVKYNRNTIFNRLFTWGLGSLQIWFKIVRKFKKDYLFIVSNPPFAPLLPLLLQNNFQLLIYDIYPDVLFELGYLSYNSRILSWWQNLNREVFVKARKIFTITESMKKVLQNYVQNSLIEVVPVWTDNTFLKPIDPSKNLFLKKHKLEGKFVVMYSGNLGLSSNIELLIEIAAKIRNEKVVFLVIGDGARKGKIIERAKSLELNNVFFLPWQPTSELPFSFSSASLAVIFHGTKASNLIVPSKFYNFLSVGAPLMCVTTKGSEIENLVAKYNCGRSFEEYDIYGMTNFINEILENKKLYNLMKKNSLKASQDFNVHNINKFLE